MLLATPLSRLLVAGLWFIACAPAEEPSSLLPRPTGSYRVATRVLPPMVDSTRLDTAFSSGARTVAVQLWYPTKRTRGTTQLYLDSVLLDSVKATSSTPDLVETWRTLHTHAVVDAPVAAGRFPLVLFSPGFGMARAYYTSWIEELVSQGFIVAAIDHPFAGLTILNGRVYKERPDSAGPAAQTSQMALDLRFVLPLLLTQIEIEGGNIAAVGHSIGGAAALEACRLEPRILACVNLDGAAFGAFSEFGVGRPFMVVHQQPVYPDAKPDGKLAMMGREIDSTWKAIAARQNTPVIRLSVRGTGHFSFSDAPFIRPALVSDGGGLLTDSLLVLRGTTSVIAEYLRNVFKGEAGKMPTLPYFITPTRGMVPVTELAKPQ